MHSYYIDANHTLPLTNHNQRYTNNKLDTFPLLSYKHTNTLANMQIAL